MSYTNYLTRQMTEKVQSKFEKGIGPLIGSRRLINNYTIHRNDMLHGILVLCFIGIMFLPTSMLSLVMNQGNLPQWLYQCLQPVCSLYMISALMLYSLDLNSTECYFREFNKSTYVLSTGISKNNLKNNKGLAGEYKSYVLSRSLQIPHRILFNVCVPMPNGNFQEVDAIIITRNIIYVMECKNRGGTFVGNIDDKDWKQYIGNQEHTTGNIYMQNQKHTMALDRFLLERGLIKNGQNVCINTIFSTGDMSMRLDKVPLDLVFGNMKHIQKYIEKNDANFDDGTDTSGLMEKIYDALLPYALYTQGERQRMMEERDFRSENKEFMVGDFRQVVIPGGIPGITAPGEQAVIRYNNLYTQLRITDGRNFCWQTRTDIPSTYLR